MHTTDYRCLSLGREKSSVVDEMISSIIYIGTHQYIALKVLSSLVYWDVALSLTSSFLHTHKSVDNGDKKKNISSHHSNQKGRVPTSSTLKSRSSFGNKVAYGVVRTTIEAEVKRPSPSLCMIFAPRLFMLSTGPSISTFQIVPQVTAVLSCLTL